MEWSEKPLGEILRLNYGWSLPEKNRVSGEFPVFGSNGVVGTHHKPLVTSEGIIVGRKGSAGLVHFSRTPFCPIDTTFFVTPADTILDIEFLYFLLRHLDLKRILSDVGVPGLNRESAYREIVRFPIDKKEQRKIAAVLGLVQQAIEHQERLMTLTAELRKALLHELFTHGLHNEPQKQTELGTIPQSWEVVSLGSVMSQNPKNGLYKHSSNYGSGTLILRIDDFSNDGDIVSSATNRVRIDYTQEQKYGLSKDDIVVNRVNSLSHLGKTALVGALEEAMVFESNMMRFRTNPKKALPDFVFRWLNTRPCKQQIIGNAKRAVGQASINQGNLKAIKMPFPPLKEQMEIVAYLQSVETKIELHQRKYLALCALFRTLVHELMNAHIRLHNLELAELRQPQ